MHSIALDPAIPDRVTALRVAVADGTAAPSDADHTAPLNTLVSIVADVMPTEEVVGVLRSNAGV